MYKRALAVILENPTLTIMISGITYVVFTQAKASLATWYTRRIGTIDEARHIRIYGMRDVIQM